MHIQSIIVSKYHCTFFSPPCLVELCKCIYCRKNDDKKEKIFFHVLSLSNYLSVLNGDAGSPSLLYKFGLTGLSAQAYRTCNGFCTSSFQTIILSPSIFALAQTNFLSAPAITNSPGSSPSFVISPRPV